MLQDKSGDVQCNSHWSCTLPETTLVDYISERAASAWLRAREQLVPAKPFLLFVGFRRPHLDMAAPPATLKQVPKNAPLPDLSEPVVTGRSGAAVPFRQSLSRFECYDEIVGRHVGRLPMSPISRFAQMNGTLHSMRQGYFAAASWMDSRLGPLAARWRAQCLSQERFAAHAARPPLCSSAGKLLDTLDSTRFQNDTAVVFFSDHGFAVGEHGIFCKNALFEQQTRVAMIVAPPRRDFVRASSRLDPVDLVDVFPTLIHIATGRRPAVAAAVDESGLVLDGKSLYAFDSQQSAFAFSQYSRCENTSYHAMCTIQRSPCGRVAATFMGYAVRTAAARYVEWRPFQESRTGCFKATWQGEDAYLHTQMPAVWQIDPVSVALLRRSTAASRRKQPTTPMQPRRRRARFGPPEWSSGKCTSTTWTTRTAWRGSARTCCSAASCRTCGARSSCRPRSAGASIRTLPLEALGRPARAGGSCASSSRTSGWTGQRSPKCKTWRANVWARFPGRSAKPGADVPSFLPSCSPPGVNNKA
jgi:hypothetical protein